MARNKYEVECDGRCIVAKVSMQQNKAGQWFWHAKGYNNEITVSSEAFSSKAACYDSALDHARQLQVPFYVAVPG